MVLISIKQHLSNIRSSVYKKVKEHWGLVEKKTLLIRKSVYLEPFQTSAMKFFSKNGERLFTVSYFPKKPLSKVFDRVLNTPLFVQNKEHVTRKK